MAFRFRLLDMKMKNVEILLLRKTLSVKTVGLYYLKRTLLTAMTSKTNESLKATPLLFHTVTALFDLALSILHLIRVLMKNA